MITADDIRKEKNRYAREWRKKNPDKCKEYSDRYWAKKLKERGDVNGAESDNRCEAD